MSPLFQSLLPPTATDQCELLPTQFIYTYPHALYIQHCIIDFLISQTRSFLSFCLFKSYTKEKRSFACDVYGTYFTALLSSPPCLLIMLHNRHSHPEFIMPSLILSPPVSYLQPQLCLQKVLELTSLIRIYCWQPIMAKVISGSCGSCKSWAPISSLPHRCSYTQIKLLCSFYIASNHACLHHVFYCQYPCTCSW